MPTSNRTSPVEGAKSGQDTPGRPRSSSSRQQTQSQQHVQSGNPELDSRGPKVGRDNPNDVQYRDRPADEGKHGDGDQEPNSRNP